MAPARTWMVMVRDISHAVQIADEPVMVLCVVFDVDTGLVLGIAALPSPTEACRTAFHTALTTPAIGAPFPPGPPGRVLCTADALAYAEGELATLLGPSAITPELVVPGPEAEDIVDSFIGRLSGRAQPDEPPAPADWRHLIELIARYAAAEPWTDPATNRVDLRLSIMVDGELAHYVPVVLGHDRIQLGLVLYPGTEMPRSVAAWRPGHEVAMPDGTLMCYLEPPDETPREAAGRAVRHGWPPESELFPIFATIAPNGPADVARRDTRHLSLAAAAALQYVGRSGNAPETAGSLAFPDGRVGEYSLTSRPTGPPGTGGFDAAPLSRLRPRRDEVVTYRVRIDLKGAKPPCWRRLELASDLMLDELHEIMQAAFGWSGGHLHQFAAGGSSFYHPYSEQYLSEDDIEDGEEGIAERDVRLDESLVDAGDRLFYLYDFGDSWEHVIALEAVLPRKPAAPRAVCTKGRRPSPPEDCGGIHGYEMLVAANDSTNPGHHDALRVLRETYGPGFDPADLSPVPFDLDSINRALRDLFD
ncbi:MAG TPA: plasmid pRiA4b ORF-3 family protein [Jiangellaceae bacterium]